MTRQSPTILLLTTAAVTAILAAGCAVRGPDILKADAPVNIDGVDEVIASNST